MKKTPNIKLNYSILSKNILIGRTDKSETKFVTERICAEFWDVFINRMYDSYNLPEVGATITDVLSSPEAEFKITIERIQ